jgi:hypothetical protein
MQRSKDERDSVDPIGACVVSKRIKLFAKKDSIKDTPIPQNRNHFDLT